MKTFIFFSLFLPKLIYRLGEPHSRSEGRCRPQCPKCLCYLHHSGTGASLWQTHRDSSAPQWWATENCPNFFSFLLVVSVFFSSDIWMWLQVTNLFHRTSQPIGHIRERQALIQPVWAADLFPPWFHSLHSQRFRTWAEGWWLLTLLYYLTLSTFDISHMFQFMCPDSVAGVCEEALPQGHSEQPCLDAQLLSWLAVWTSGAAQSHQRTAVPCWSQRQHEWHQHPVCKGELRAG